MVLVVVRTGPNGKPETSFGGFGETSPGSHQPPTPESVLRLCSLTKIFATDLLVKLASDPVYAKTVRLDTPLQSLFPVAMHVPVAAEPRPITLGDLATHTAGLPREIGPTPRGSAHFTYPSYNQRWALLPDVRLKATPGTVALYSNLGFDLLGDALESAAKMPYSQLLLTRTTAPLGMAETSFTPTDAECARLLLGAHPEGSCTPTINSAGSSGLYSTAADMGRFLQYLLGVGQPAIARAKPRGPGRLP